jgi:hypothetical protein
MSAIPVCTASQWLTVGALSTQATTPAKMANTNAASTNRRALILASPNAIHGAVAAHIQVHPLAISLAAWGRTYANPIFRAYGGRRRRDRPRPAYLLETVVGGGFVFARIRPHHPPGPGLCLGLKAKVNGGKQGGPRDPLGGSWLPRWTRSSR